MDIRPAYDGEKIDVGDLFVIVDEDGVCYEYYYIITSANEKNDMYRYTNSGNNSIGCISAADMKEDCLHFKAKPHSNQKDNK